MRYARIALACVAAGGTAASHAAGNGLAAALPAGIPLGMFWRVIFPAMLLILALAVVLSFAYVQLRKEVARRRQVEARLKAARDLADSATLAKAAFFATMSHEIRTPMSGIIGMLDLLKREAMQGDQQQMLAAVDHAANSLLHILDDVLDFSKMEANRMHLESVPVDLRALARSVVMVIGEPARRRGVKTELRIDDGLAHEILGDPLRIRQILTNLLSNAAKFTRQGEIVLAVTVQHAGSVDQLLRFSVADTGIGIASGRLPHLLEPFEQAEPSTSRQYGGTGLGLPVSNRLAALMHGTLRLTSEPGQGTRADFTCTFPVHGGQRPMEAGSQAGTRGRAVAAREVALRREFGGREEEGPHARESEGAASTLVHVPGDGAPRVLVADDHGINRDLVRRQLAVLGISCDVVEDAASALEALRARPYALLLTDCQMPPMNGRELARQWREIEQRTRPPELERGVQRPARMPVVLMSATLAPIDSSPSSSTICARHYSATCPARRGLPRPLTRAWRGRPC
jgi:signal transduction histidine kinase